MNWMNGLRLCQIGWLLLLPVWSYGQSPADTIPIMFSEQMNLGGEDVETSTTDEAANQLVSKQVWFKAFVRQEFNMEHHSLMASNEYDDYSFNNYVIPYTALTPMLQLEDLAAGLERLAALGVAVDDLNWDSLWNAYPDTGEIVANYPRMTEGMYRVRPHLDTLPNSAFVAFLADSLVPNKRSRELRRIRDLHSMFWMERDWLGPVSSVLIPVYRYRQSQWEGQCASFSNNMLRITSSGFAYLLDSIRREQEMAYQGLFDETRHMLSRSPTKGRFEKLLIKWEALAERDYYPHLMQEAGEVFYDAAWVDHWQAWPELAERVQQHYLSPEEQEYYGQSYSVVGEWEYGEVTEEDIRQVSLNEHRIGIRSRDWEVLLDWLNELSSSIAYAASKHKALQQTFELLVPELDSLEREFFGEHLKRSAWQVEDMRSDIQPLTKFLAVSDPARATYSELHQIVQQLNAKGHTMAQKTYWPNALRDYYSRRVWIVDAILEAQTEK